MNLTYGVAVDGYPFLRVVLVSLVVLYEVHVEINPFLRDRINHSDFSPFQPPSTAQPIDAPPTTPRGMP